MHLEPVYYSSALQTWPWLTICINTVCNGSLNYLNLEWNKLQLVLNWTSDCNLLTISSLTVFIRMSVDLCSKVTNCCSQLFWLIRFFKALTRSITANGDISWADQLEISTFQTIQLPGFQIINGQISIDRFMEFLHYQFFQVIFWLILEFEKVFMENFDDYRAIFDSSTPQTEPIPHFNETLGEF